MKKILVPTDFSDHSLYAAKVAANIAKITEARIYFLHVVDIPVYDQNTGLSEYYDIGEGLAILTQIKKRFEELFRQPFLDGINVAEVLQFNGVHENVTQQAEKHEIDLVVMGSHGASGWNEFFIGSNTERIVRTSSCPVLTIKKEHENFNPENIVFASSFIDEDDEAFEKTKELAQLFNSTIHLLKVNTPADFETTTESMQKLSSFAEKQRISKDLIHIFNSYRIEDGILSFSKENNIDLIAMATHGRTGLAHFFTGSIAAELVNHSRLPVFTMKIKE